MEINKLKKDKSNKMIYIVLYALLGTIFSYGSLKLFSLKNYKVKREELATISGKMSKNAEVEYFRGKRIRIQLTNINKYTFSIEHPVINWTFSNGFEGSVYQSDSIEVDILKEEYEKKITNSKRLNILDQIDYKFIEVYGLRKGKQQFLTLKSANKAINEDAKNSSWIYGLVAIAIWTLVCFEIRSYRKLRTKLNTNTNH